MRRYNSLIKVIIHLHTQLNSKIARIYLETSKSNHKQHVTCEGNTAKHAVQTTDACANDNVVKKNSNQIIFINL